MSLAHLVECNYLPGVPSNLRKACLCWVACAAFGPNNTTFKGRQHIETLAILSCDIYVIYLLYTVPRHD